LKNVKEFGVWEDFQIVIRGLYQTGETEKTHRSGYKQNVSCISMSCYQKAYKGPASIGLQLSWVRAPLCRNLFVHFNYSNNEAMHYTLCLSKLRKVSLKWGFNFLSSSSR
jgi:hypothetical protein